MNQRLIDQLTLRLSSIVDDYALAWELSSVPFPERSHVLCNLRNLGRIDQRSVLDFSWRFDWLLVNRVGDDLPRFVPGDVVVYRGNREKVLASRPAFSGGWEVVLLHGGVVHERRLRHWDACLCGKRRGEVYDRRLTICPDCNHLFEPAWFAGERNDR